MSDFRCIFFDAVGTLLFPCPPPADVYADVGRRFGSRRAAALLRSRFRDAFRRQEELDFRSGLRTDEGRERERWRAIVTEVVDDAADPEGCFAALWEHFAEPASWACAPGTAAVLDELARRGYALGLASNFDGRLYAVAAGRPELRAIRRVVVSSAAGWRKPAPQFFAEMRRVAGQPPARILFVGDDRRNDYDGARAAGMGALLLGAVSREEAAGAERVGALSDLLARCPGV